MERLYRIVRGCTICSTCVFACPVSAIRMERTTAVIDQDKCTACGKCYDNCPFEAIEVVEVQETPRKEGDRND